ncbi:MAG TPA: phage tail sheath C-terminal domain-containing protein [Candidatus Acidoferrales bacterium]|jgi:phage tail sheath protein FI|nr:phage tail sheath C-terminal domain-containing protein [Candidatus Acidoferrales bacterium]
MAVTYRQPGVYIVEKSSGVRTITGVATSITAFIGRALRGPTDKPYLVQSFAEFDRTYGGLWAESALGYAVQQFFINGGRDALICRVHKNATAATVTLPANFTLAAASEGDWGEKLRVRVETAPVPPGEAANSRFNLLVKDTGSGNVETFRNLSTDPLNPRFVTKVLELQSDLVRMSGAVPAVAPAASGAAPAGADPLDVAPSSTPFGANGSDGVAIDDNSISAPALQATRGGLWMLDEADLFNLLCIPPLTRATDVGQATWDAAVAYARTRRAMVIVDAPDGWTKPAQVLAGMAGVVTPDDHAALFFPRLRVADPLRENRLETFAPSGAVAGIFARTDAQRGVWKAPAGIDATLVGVSELTAKLTDDENGQLNPKGVNCLRVFPVHGRVVWGARTLRGDDQMASEWKYIPVRRTALFIEESLFRGTQWVVFEPNDEPLWAQIRLNVGAFMQDLFRQGAFQGRSPREAYFVRCDRETTTQNDIDRGVVNIFVGFAPLKPAEFVVITIQQIAGQTAA